jgi:hypothetical protein
MNGSGCTGRTAPGRHSQGARSCTTAGRHVVAGADATGPLTRAVCQHEAMVERGRRRQASRQSLRCLVDQTDLVIAACERAHLAGTTAVTDELAARAEAVWTEARSIFAGTAGWSAQRAVDRLTERPAVWIHQLMDALWGLQDETFNALVPWRVQLGDNDESERWSERIPA